ncbi:MAG: HAD family phosphatase [Burkholderiales bacterium]|jgi:putative hydrolase of the HAD superfamily|nr:HAD family phosphatase [Burkholderiales bacterium]
MYKTVVFDLGAVLLHWQPVDLVATMLPQHAPTPEAAQQLCERIFQGLHPGSTWAEFDRGRVEPDDLAVQLAAQTGVDADDLLDFIHAIPDHLHTKLDTAALLPRLQARGHRLVYLSNMPTPYSERLLQEREFFHYFDDGIFSGLVGLVKPEHAIYAKAESEFGLTPEHTVFVDDNAHNVQTARARGWQAIQFLDAAQCERDLQALGWLEPAHG